MRTAQLPSPSRATAMLRWCLCTRSKQLSRPKAARRKEANPNPSECVCDCFKVCFAQYDAVTKTHFHIAKKKQLKIGRDFFESESSKNLMLSRGMFFLPPSHINNLMKHPDFSKAVIIVI